MEDHDLLQLFTQGDYTAFSKIYEKYWKGLYTMAYSRLKDKKQSKDIVQDLFVTLWERRDNLHIENLDRYLYSSVRYNVLKQIANHKITVDFFDVLENLPLQSSSADSNIISRELLEAYHALIEKMPPQRKKIFQMRFERNMKTKAIAEELDITQKTVQNQLLTSANQIRSLVTTLLVFLSFLLMR
jgi:RNA polymerase sigma-70 factor (family 1)